MAEEKLRKNALNLMRDPEIRKEIEIIIGDLIYSRVRNIANIIPIVESVRSASYVIDNMRPWQGKGIGKIRSDAISAAPKNGLFMEFGVWRANMLNSFAREFPDISFYGFDSFEGLPESWSSLPDGFFDLSGQIPEVESNVSLIRGWFSESLPRFLQEHSSEKVSFIHLDCDLYSSTMTVLTLLRDRLQVGTQIVLDDYMLEPGWAQEEHKAFHDFCHGHRIEYSFTGWQNEAPSVSASVVLTKV